MIYPNLKHPMGIMNAAILMLLAAYVYSATDTSE